MHSRHRSGFAPARNRPARQYAGASLLFSALVLLTAACWGKAASPPTSTARAETQRAWPPIATIPPSPAQVAQCSSGVISPAFIPVAEPVRTPAPVDAAALDTKWPIKHVVFIMKENRSFDNFFARFPAADGTTTGMIGDRRVELAPCIQQQLPADLLHNYPTALRSYNHGEMNGFGISEYAKGAAYSAAVEEDIPNYWQWAKEYVLGDNFFASAMGPSFPNHLFSVAASSAGTHDNPVLGPDEFLHLQAKGLAKSWGCDVADPTSYVLVYDHRGKSHKEDPCFDIPTAADSLNDADIPWASYAATDTQEGYIWNVFDAIRQVRYSPQWRENVFPVRQLVPDIRAGRLPPVTWVTPEFWLSDHPDVNLCNGENWTVTVVDAIMQSSMWKDTAIFITWDDWGGFYDHVPPDQLDDFGLGFRVPLLVISPYAKKGFIDHQPREFSSVLRFIGENWGIPPLTSREAKAGNLAEAFDFSQEPRPPDPLPLRADCRLFQPPP